MFVNAKFLFESNRTSQVCTDDDVLETVYSNIDCMSGQPSVKAAEVVAGTSKDENLGSTSRPGNGL